MSESRGPDLGWTHWLERGCGELTLLLLHCMGGSETQLLELGREVAPKANLLGARGRSLEEGVPRYFRRSSATDYDQPQVLSEAGALASFTSQATKLYGLNPAKTVLIGHGNGAELGLALLLGFPVLLAGAALLRPTMPLDTPPTPPLNNLPIVLLHGAHDPYASHGKGIGSLLRTLGAEVEDRRLNAGHEITDQDIVILERWLKEVGAGL